MKFELINGYYIKKYDALNWVLAKTLVVKKEGKTKGDTRESIKGYYATLAGAWSSACDILPLEAENLDELRKTISALKGLKSSLPES